MSALDRIRAELAAHELGDSHGYTSEGCEICAHASESAAMRANWPTYLAALLDVAEAHKELFEFLEVDHWCNACEAKQEHDQGEYCPLTQRLIASRKAHDNLEATP